MRMWMRMILMKIQRSNINRSLQSKFHPIKSMYIPKEQYMYITKFAVIKIKDKNKFYDPTITGKRVHAT